MEATNHLSSFQFPVQVSIDDQKFDYVLTLDETGHVYAAIPVVYDLPLAAQQLILGDSDKAMERKIKAYGRLFKYLVPLVLAEKLPSYQAELLPLVIEIRKRLQERGLTWVDLPLDGSVNSPAMQALSIFGNNRQVSSPWAGAWGMIVTSLESLDNAGEGEVLSAMAHRYPDAASNFLPAVIPLCNEDIQSRTFAELRYAKIRTKRFKDYLLEELEHPSCKPCVDGILGTLAGFGPDQKDIYEAALRFYERETNLEGRASDRLMNILEHYPTPRTKEIGFDIIRRNDRQNAAYAARTLIQIGVAQNEILDLMLPFFREATAEASVATFRILSDSISPEYMPTAEEVLDVAVRILVKNNDTSVVVSTSNIAYKNRTYLLVDRLFDLLNHEVSAVKQMVLWIIKYFHNTVKAEFYTKPYDKFYGDGKPLNPKIKINFKPFVEVRFTTRYWELTKDPDTDTARAAIALIAKVGYEQRRKDYIDSLLDLAEHDSRYVIQQQIIEAINEILYRIPYPPQIEPFYLSILDSNRISRYAAVYGLRFSPNQAFKKAIWEKYQDDQDNSVSRAIKNELLKMPNKASS